ncbi:MAG: GntR family transcriptional regulator [Lachnospiraceae bacterium]|nr:GntR family transcriptional regulator [Lachnospiraceae bacterium]
MFINIDFRDKRPLYEQVCDKIEELILRGVIEPDEALPSVRSLAVELSINPNTVQKAYALLESRGLTYSAAGRGSFAAGATELLPKKREEIAEEIAGLIEKAEKFGITKEELIELIKQKEGGKRDA